jgi:hypothetical protein
LDGGSRKFRFVTIAAEVTQENVLQIGSDQIGEDIRGGIIAEVTVAAHDALFDAPRAAGVVLQEFHVVVGFEDEDV